MAKKTPVVYLRHDLVNVLEGIDRARRIVREARTEVVRASANLQRPVLHVPAGSAQAEKWGKLCYAVSSSVVEAIDALDKAENELVGTAGDTDNLLKFFR